MGERESGRGREERRVRAGGGEAGESGELRSENEGDEDA